MKKEEDVETRQNKFNWYPGHIAKAERELKEKIKIIDIIVELRDARIPEASKHQDLQEWAGAKPIITVLNKSDLAAKSDSGYIAINSKDSKTLKLLIKAIEVAAQPVEDKFKAQGVINRPARVMVVGYPNVGKSTLINSLSKTKKAKVEDRAGVTRQQQWIDVKSKLNIKLLDTPGIIPTKFYSDGQALRLAICNCLGDNAFDHVEIAREAIKLIEGLYPGGLLGYYKLEGEDASDEMILEKIAQSQNLVKDSQPDIGRAADRVLRDYREGKLGIMLLE